MTETPGFLSDLAALQWKPLAKHGFMGSGLFLGKGANAIEIAVARASAVPPQTAMVETWKARRGGRPAPVILVVLHPGGAAMCGAAGMEPPVHLRMEADLIERLCREALDQPDRHAALQFLSQALPSLDTAIPGLTNEGLLALHELQHGVPERDDWTAARRKATSAVGKRGKDILTSLGFRIEQIDNLTFRLRADGRSSALAVLLREDESPEAGNDRFNSLSPVSYALKKADDENLPWVLLTQGKRLRLYAAKVDAGVGQRGRTETYVECQPSLLSEEQMPYLWLLFSAEALAPNGSLIRILQDSQRFSGDLAERLRERIYDSVVPILATGIADQQDAVPTHEGLMRTYEMALTVLFRLLFIAYAEDRDLLPYRTNDAYRRRSLKQKAQELADRVKSKTPIADGDSHWNEVRALWRAVAVGNPEWGVPAYNGGLFADDPNVSEAGSSLAEISLPNEAFEAALRHLLVIETAEGVLGPVDFRSLGVREFGTVYEGLLESELAYAGTNLQLKKGEYMHAREGQPVAVAAGEVYLHNRSGARKSSGSYYTKPFAVEHLLDGALERAIDDHFARLDAKDDTGAAEAFFDFRVADIAMGSGHFLISAIDRIEKRMAGYLAERSLPGVSRGLADLRIAAAASLNSGTADKIEDGQLLRRQIARRCIYGIDLNQFSVQLARLSVWIHTFVPGLPLSFLDHNLVHGNALIGVSSINEIRKKFESYTNQLFEVDAEALLGRAAKPLRRLANLNDANLAEIEKARSANIAARAAIANTERLCDLITAASISDNPSVAGIPLEDWERLDGDRKADVASDAARQELMELHALHFPIAFPEVFLRERPGFDVIIGNPPWEKAKVEEHTFWTRYIPGFRKMSRPEQLAQQKRLSMERPDVVTALETERAIAKRIRTALIRSDYPGIGKGDPDLYIAFCWRFWRLSNAKSGRIGVVLPRSALAAKGSTDFRRAVFKHAARVDVTMLLNRLQWVFPEVESRYSISLVSIASGVPTKKSIFLRGPFSSETAFREGMLLPAPAFTSEEVSRWNDTVSLPLLPDPDSIAVFRQLRQAPRLDVNKNRTGGGLAHSSRPGVGRVSAENVHGFRRSDQAWCSFPDTELHATARRHQMTFEGEEHSDLYWPVYKGESFDIWEPDTGTYYAWANPEPVLAWLQKKRLKAAKGHHNSPHREFPLEHLIERSTLPCLAPRIAFRDITNRTNQRTVIACLIPPKRFIAHQAPYLLWPRGDKKDEAFLLGILCSIPFDWYARRFVETHVSYFIFNTFPVPRPGRSDMRWQRVVELAGRLACPDRRFAAWAETVGVAYSPLDLDEKEDMIHELDAVSAHLYGLDNRQLVHVFATFHEKWDYHDRLEGVLRHFRAWNGR